MNGVVNIRKHLKRAQTDATIQRLVREHLTEMVSPEQLEWLAACLLGSFWDEDAIVVEIGTWVGHTTLFCLRVLEVAGVSTPILAIDPFGRAEREPYNAVGNLGAWIDLVYGQGGWGRCFPLMGRSQDTAPLVADGIGVLIVDGSHLYDAVNRDLDLYTPKLAIGGYLLIDDTVEPYTGVIAALDDWLATDPPFEVLHRSDFAVLRRGEGSPRV